MNPKQQERRRPRKSARFMGRKGCLEHSEVIIKVAAGAILWYINFLATLSEHLWFLSLVELSVLEIGGLECEFGGLE